MPVDIRAVRLRRKESLSFAAALHLEFLKMCGRPLIAL
jgi:hypothetical protein